VPGTPVASAVTATGATLTWAASSDASPVRYRVFREAGETDVLAGESTTTTLAVTGLSPGTTYQFYVVALDNAGNTSAPSAAVSVTTSPETSSTCAVTWSANNWGNGGFTANISIRNTGTAAMNGWTLRFTFGNTARVSQGWSATWTQTGAEVSAVNMSYNGTIAPGASVGLGFNGTAGPTPTPTTFTLNNSPCTVG
jgi:cellulase/cellobiase CelA1